MYKGELFILVVLLFSCKEDREKTSPKYMPLIEAVYASGNLKAINQYLVYPQNSGILKKKYVNENDTIAIGDVIGEIENDVSKLQLNNSQIALSEASRNISPNSPILQQLKTEVLVTQTQMRKDSMDYDRFKNLYSEKSIAKSELENKEVQYQKSLGEYNKAIENYRNNLNQIKTRYENAQNVLQTSAAVYNENLIKSMIHGKVYAYYKEVGEMVNINEPLALVGEKDKFTIELNIDELDIKKIKLGQEALITLDAYENIVYKSTITKIIPTMDTKTQTFVVEAEFNTSPNLLYPGLTVEANIIIHKKNKTLVIPRSFILPGDSVMDKHKNKTGIKTGIKNLEYVEVLSGLNSNSVIYK